MTSSKVSAAEGQAANARVLAQVAQLVTVRVSELHCKEHKADLETESLTLVTHLAIGSAIDDLKLTTSSRYQVSAVDEDNAEEATPENTVWTVDVTVDARWLLKSTDVTARDAQCFAIGQGALTCHPYAREVIQSATSRMGYPPATIDLLHNLWHTNREHEIDLPE